MPSRPCLKCGALTTGSYCPPHQPKQRWHHNGSSRQWRTIRERIIRRDDYRCSFVFKDGTRCPATFPLEVHHLDPYGGDIESNLLTLCRQHHPRDVKRKVAA